MKIEQIYTGCLAQGAYYIESNGEVAIIDPLREVSPYLERAKKDNAIIKYVFETHFHADFVSGHVTLAKETGATIVYGPTASPTFEALIAKDTQEFRLGDITIVALHTPGHTLESTSYLLRNEKGEDYALFSGDTLFLGDVGRPDLAQKGANMTQEELAGILYDSLRNKIIPLSDNIIVYPAHGAGSACGKNMMKETLDSLGNQKKTNYALRERMTKEEFIEEVTAGLLTPPKYFPMNVKLNKEGYADIGEVLDRGDRALNPSEFERLVNESGAIILDVRHQNEYVKGHIPRSIFIGLSGGFAPLVGTLIADVSQPILLVVPEGKELETITRLSRVGFDNTIGYLKGGFSNWKSASKEYDTVSSISVKEFKKRIHPELAIFDVRKEGEFLAEHAKNANNSPLNKINEHLSDYPAENTFFIHCQAGYRSVVAASILKSRGIHNFVDVAGGLDAMRTIGIEMTEYVCPSSLS
tara:strand:- start:18297 stop:19706 length:1410 start_codon:yes stop_codon:yes gene_type:complete